MAMKNRSSRILMLWVVQLVIASTAVANDVFVYTTGGTSVKTVRNLRSIVYKSDGIQINTKDGKSEDVAYSDFDYFRFFATPMPTSIKTADASEASIECVKGKLYIQTRLMVERVDIISISGEILARLRPNATHVSYNTSVLPTGVLLIKVLAGGKTYVKKIVNK